MHPSHCALSGRLLIIGNSGCGKTTLAEEIASRTSQPVCDLDLIHWRRDGSKRDEAVAHDMLAGLVTEPIWIIEGVYGWLAESALRRATALVWIDLSWHECRSGLLRRGLRRGMTEADHAALLAWAEAYWTRMTPSSAFGHGRLFGTFEGEKARLSNRSDIAALVAAFGAASLAG